MIPNFTAKGIWTASRAPYVHCEDDILRKASKRSNNWTMVLAVCAALLLPLTSAKSQELESVGAWTFTTNSWASFAWSKTTYGNAFGSFGIACEKPKQYFISFLGSNQSPPFTKVYPEGDDVPAGPDDPAWIQLDGQTIHGQQATDIVQVLSNSYQEAIAAGAEDYAEFGFITDASAEGAAFELQGLTEALQELDRRCSIDRAAELAKAFSFDDYESIVKSLVTVAAKCTDDSDLADYFCRDQPGRFTLSSRYHSGPPQKIVLLINSYEASDFSYSREAQRFFASGERMGTSTAKINQCFGLLGVRDGARSFSDNGNLYTCEIARGPIGITAAIAVEQGN